MERIFKSQIVNKIANRLKQINKAKIIQAVDIIIKEITKDLIGDKEITIKNFGTLSPWVLPSRLAHDLQTGEIRQTKPQRRIKFHGHASFLWIISRRRSRFARKTSKKSSAKKRT